MIRLNNELTEEENELRVIDCDIWNGVTTIVEVNPYGFENPEEATKQIKNFIEDGVKKSELLDEVLHELITLNGLYCTDLEAEASDKHFRLDLTELINKVKEEVQE